MGWFRWKGKQEPWGDNFSITVIALPDPPANEPAPFPVPYDQHIHLIAVRADIALGVLPSEHHLVVRGRRGGTDMYIATGNIPTSDPGTSQASLMTNHLSYFIRAKSHYMLNRLSDNWFLYPHDVVEVLATSSGALNYQLTNVSLTFKQWITS